MKADQINFEIVKVTPQMAEEWLENNKSNRNVRQRTVSQYAEDISAGRWRLNGDAIRFNGNGTLHDGQHRLYACIEAGKPFTTLVVRGLTDADHVTLDSGIKRTFADVLKWKGETDCNNLGAAIRAAYMYEKFAGWIYAPANGPSRRQRSTRRWSSRRSTHTESARRSTCSFGAAAAPGLSPIRALRSRTTRRRRMRHDSSKTPQKNAQPKALRQHGGHNEAC